MNVYIWGTGQAASLVRLALNTNVNILGYIDNKYEKQGKYCWDREVFNPNILLKTEFDYVIIGAFDHYWEISNQIEKMGVSTDKIIQFFNYTKLFPLKFFYNDKVIDDNNYNILFSDYVKVRMVFF